MPLRFYSDSNYCKKQSELTRLSWQKGEHDILIKPLIARRCLNSKCSSIFQVKGCDPKKFCSSSCTASVNNSLYPKRIDAKKNSFCYSCNRPLEKWDKLYCSLKCQQQYRYKKYINKWKSGQIDGNKGILTKTISSFLRHYLNEKYQEKCYLCGWDKRNPVTNKVPLEVDHINGDWSNNNEENIRLLCPNCHSLTPNFRNLNKGKGRNWRLEYLHSHQ